MSLQPAKLLTLEAAAALRETLHAAGKRLVLTNGVFDLLHPGHVSSLQAAAQLGDALLVCINSAESVRALKGPTRPVQTDAQRAYMLSALECVAGVVVFGSANTTNLAAEIQRVRPHVYAKSGDYTLETLNPLERAALEAAGTSIHFMPFVDGFSTTGLIEKLQN